MQKYIGEKFNALPQNRWAQHDQHYLRLAQLDALLDGEFYDGLTYPFYQEVTGGDGVSGTYVQVKDRRPSFRFNLFNMVANQVARKLFGGAHAPALVNPDEKVREALDALKEECDLESKMLEAIQWGSVGSVCTVFQIVPFESDGEKKSKVVARNIRSRYCTPVFNKLDELSRLLIHYPVTGSDFINAEVPVTVDVEGTEIDGAKFYWFVMELNSQREVTYQPIPIDKWSPQKARSEKLFVSLATVEHGLGFVPAHWHQYRTGKMRTYDGTCYWEQAVPNIIDLDYTVSQIGAGVRYNSVPQVVVKGQVVNTHADGSLARGAARFIQIKSDIKEGDTEEKNSDVKMLEANGNGMKIGLEHWAALCLRIAMQQICASLKDPNKVTTAMSGKGMEVLESEFLDLAQELRTVFGDKGYLKLLKKIAAACVKKNHILLSGISLTQIDALTLAWPPLSSIGMVEFQAMCLGLVGLIEAQVMEKGEAREFALSQIDMPVHSANKNYLPSVETPGVEDGALDKGEPDSDDPSAALEALSATAASRAVGPPINTKKQLAGAE